MSEYFSSFVFVAFAIAVFSFILYNEKERAAHLAFGALLAFAAILPLTEILPDVNIGGIIEEIKGGALSGEHAFETDAKAAFESGICRVVAEKFALDESSVRVLAQNFDFERMRAEKIEVTLYGTAIFADVEKIEKYVSALELGRCEVLIGI